MFLHLNHSQLPFSQKSSIKSSRRQKSIEGRELKVLKINLVSRVRTTRPVMLPINSSLWLGMKQRNLSTAAASTSHNSGSLQLLFNPLTLLYSSSISGKKIDYSWTWKYPGVPFAEKPMPWRILSALLSPLFSLRWRKYRPLEKPGPNQWLENAEINEFFFKKNLLSYIHKTVLVESIVYNCTIHAHPDHPDHV